MFALKKTNVVCKFTRETIRIRWKPITKNFVTTAKFRQNEKNNCEKYQYPHIKSLFPYMKSEMESGAEYMDVFPGKQLLLVCRSHLFYVYFAPFSGIIRELADYNKFTLKPNNFKYAEYHFIKVPFKQLGVFFFLHLKFYENISNQCRYWTTICPMDIDPLP